MHVPFDTAIHGKKGRIVRPNSSFLISLIPRIIGELQCSSIGSLQVGVHRDEISKFSFGLGERKDAETW